MAILSRVFSIPGLTFAATAQSILAIKLFPSYYSSQSHLVSVAVIFLANYFVGLLFWAILYPIFINPLRHIPGPKVSWSQRTGLPDVLFIAIPL